MAIIPQIEIFDFIKCEDLGDLNKLKLVLENLPDEKLVRKLEEKRGNGRDDYPGFGGFEEDRETLKYICTVKSNGIKCKGCEKCPYYNKAVRIKLSEDRRRFTPVARSSYKWERIYKSRTAVERVNSRIDNVYGFERHFIRGLKKMKFRCSIALLVMLVLAIGRIKQKQPELMRSLKIA